MNTPPENDAFWDFYWDMRLRAMENLGKQAAIRAASRLIRRIAQETSRPVRLLELGSGTGEIIGALLEAHSQLCAVDTSLGVDYNPQSLAKSRKDYASLHCVEGDFTDPRLLAGLGKFDLVLLVNALHEVFTAAYSPELGEVDAAAGKQRVEQALAGAAGCLAPGGWLALFDGLEPPGDPLQVLRIRFCDYPAREEFETFASQYHPFRISFREVDGPLCIELPRRDFTRYITKSIFLGKRLWETERLESYQYFTEEEFRTAFSRQGLEISELSTLTVNEEKWRHRIEIGSSETDFPQEHILILAQPGGR